MKTLLTIALFIHALSIFAFDPSKYLGEYKGSYKKTLGSESFNLILSQQEMIFITDKTGTCATLAKPTPYKILLDNEPILLPYEQAVAIYGTLDCEETGLTQIFIELDSSKDINQGYVKGAIFVQDIDFDEIINKDIKLRKKRSN